MKAKGRTRGGIQALRVPPVHTRTAANKCGMLQNGPSGRGTRDLLEASYSLLRIRERRWKCVFYIMDCVITIGYIYTVSVPLS